jgi:hypothetical protein
VRGKPEQYMFFWYGSELSTRKIEPVKLKQEKSDIFHNNKAIYKMSTVTPTKHYISISFRELNTIEEGGLVNAHPTTRNISFVMKHKAGNSKMHLDSSKKPKIKFLLLT